MPAAFIVDGKLFFFRKAEHPVVVLFKVLFLIKIFQLFSVRGRRITGVFCKLFAEILIVFVADLRIDFGEGDIRAFDEFFCLFDTQIIDIMVDGHSELLVKQAV